MTIDSIVKRIRGLRDQTLETAAESLRANDERRYRGLSDIAVRLTALIPVSDLPDDTVAADRPIPAPPSVIQERVESEYESVLRPMSTSTTEIFAKRRGVTYKAELDTSRISSGGRGECVLYQGQWMTASGAAGEITGTAVNGWQNFWRFRRQDGSEGPIQELRDRQQRTDADVPW